MSVVYKKTSPYQATSFYGNFLDVLTYRRVTPQIGDVEYVIDKVYENRPDLLAYDLYGDTALWWVFSVRNPDVIRDPVFDFVPGVTIYLPNKNTLVQDLGV